MAIWSMTAPRISGPSVAAAPFGRWMNSLQRQASDYGYASAVTLAAVVAIVALPDTAPSTDLVFAPLALALFTGFLLTVRLAPGRPSAALVLLPAMVIDARLGLAALIAVGYAAIVVNLIRGLRGPRVLSTARPARRADRCA